MSKGTPTPSVPCGVQQSGPRQASPYALMLLNQHIRSRPRLLDPPQALSSRCFQHCLEVVSSHGRSIVICDRRVRECVFITILSHSHVPVPIPIPIPVAAYIHSIPVDIANGIPVPSRENSHIS